MWVSLCVYAHVCVHGSDGEEQAALYSNCLAFSILPGLSAGGEAPAALGGGQEWPRWSGWLWAAVFLCRCNLFLESTLGIVCAPCL